MCSEKEERELVIDIFDTIGETRVMILKVGVHRAPYSDVGDHKHIEHMDTPMPQRPNCSNYCAVA